MKGQDRLRKRKKEGRREKETREREREGEESYSGGLTVKECAYGKQAIIFLFKKKILFHFSLFTLSVSLPRIEVGDV